jgi:hypothetical protein
MNCCLHHLGRFQAKFKQVSFWDDFGQEVKQLFGFFSKKLNNFFGPILTKFNKQRLGRFRAKISNFLGRLGKN